MTSKPNPRTANGSRRRNLRARVLARDERCWLCKRIVDKTLKTPHPMSPEVHELIPVSRGGDPYDLKNCVLTHRTHNRWIGARTPDEITNTIRRQAPNPVNTSRAW